MVGSTKERAREYQLAPRCDRALFDAAACVISFLLPHHHLHLPLQPSLSLAALRTASPAASRSLLLLLLGLLGLNSRDDFDFVRAGTPAADVH